MNANTTLPDNASIAERVLWNMTQPMAERIGQENWDNHNDFVNSERSNQVALMAEVRQQTADERAAIYQRAENVEKLVD